MLSAKTVYEASPAWIQTVLLNAYALGIEAHRYGWAYHRELRCALDRETWPRERIRAYQLERIRAVLDLAYRDSPYYRTTLADIGFEPGDLRTLDVVQDLPLLTKEKVRTQGEVIMTSDTPELGWVHGHTSGTTGSPLGLWYDRGTCVMTNVVDGRQKSWGGRTDREWIGLLLGRVVVPPSQEHPPFWRANHVQRQLWFSSFHLSPANLDHYVREIRRRRLRFLEGYPSTLFILASHVLDLGEVLPMRSVFTSSETLHSLQREAIEEAFECRIFDFYGHAERTIFACECEAHEGKHVAEDFGLVELVDAEGQPVGAGELGYLTGTSLHNTAMPMIRYRTGDISKLLEGRCSCGRTFKRIASVSTKAEDLVITPGGRMISPSVLTHPFKPFDAILKSQIIQEAPDRLLVKIVATDRFRPEDSERLRARIQERVGEQVAIQIEEVSEIPRAASGKYRWIISRVDHARQVDWKGTGETGRGEVTR